MDATVRGEATYTSLEGSGNIWQIVFGVDYEFPVGEGLYVLVETTEANEDGTSVDVKFPLAVVDALLSGPEGTLNFEAAINALAAEGDGHIVSIRDGDETVRVWIDDQNESD